MKVSMQKGTYANIDKSSREIELQERLKTRSSKNNGFTERERIRYENRKKIGTIWAKLVAVTIVIYFVYSILLSFIYLIKL